MCTKKGILGGLLALILFGLCWFGFSIAFTLWVLARYING